MFHKRIFMAASLLFAILLCVLGNHSPAYAAGGMDWGKKCTLTVEAGNIKKEDAEDITVDLYKVAWIQKDDKRGYRFVVNDALDDTRIDGITTGEFLSWSNLGPGMRAAEWEMASQAMAKSIFGVGESWNPSSARIAPAASQKMLGGKAVFNNLDFAFYLAIARDSDMDAGNYVTADKDGQLITISEHGMYTYSFLPVLLSLPGNDGGNWDYDIEAVLKSSKEDTTSVTGKSYGTLGIKKILLKHARKKISFRFLAEIYRNGDDYKAGKKPVQSFPVSATFDQKGEKFMQVSKKIPAGSFVVVKEINPVKPYYIEKSQWRKIMADGTYYDHKNMQGKGTVVAGNIGKGESILVTFTNSYKKDRSSIINRPLTPDKNQDKKPVKTGESELLWIFIVSLVFLLISGVFLISKNMDKKKKQS